MEEVSFLKVERRGASGRIGGGVGQCSCEVGDDEDRRTTHSPGVGEKEPYLSTPNNISHVPYPGVYPIGMARGDIHGLTGQRGSQRRHLRSVERSVNRTDVVRV